MAVLDPLYLLLAATTLAALAGAFGAIPFLSGHSPARKRISAAYSLAGGVMTGLAYLLMVEGLGRDAASCVLGAVVGASCTYWTQRLTGLDDLATEPAGESERKFGYRTLLQTSLHSAAEGIAIGTAAAVALPLGLFSAFALTLHNIGEGMALTDILRGRGVSTRHSAVLAVATDLGQPLLAVATFATLQALPRGLATALGFAAGSLFFLVLTELAPVAYRRGSREWVAVLLSGAAALVILGKAYLLSGPG